MACAPPSRHYFDREPEKLTLAQSAMLAGMVQAPSRLAPTRNLARRAEAQPAGAAGDGRHRRRSRQARAQRDQLGAAGRATSQGPDRHLFRRLGRARRAAGVRGRLWRGQGADHARRRPAAAGGARDRQRRRSAMRRRRWSRCGPTAGSSRWSAARATRNSPFNRATQARRQPGSAFKLFVYLAALRAGYTPDSMIEDRPITIDGWTPGNSDGVYRGSITLREAFARSSNAATVRLSEQVGRAECHPRRARARHSTRR